MSTSSTYPIKWARFPSALASKALIKGVKEFAFKEEDGRPPTPYQFTMPIMANIYKELLPSVAGSLVLIKGDGKLLAAPPAPENVIAAGAAQLRAIAYFSWHGGRRLFATRRVYPSYFDFLSLSYVDEGWGALGELLAKIDLGEVNGRKPFVEVKDIATNHRFLPFLKEADRLDYQAAFVIPFFRRKRKKAYSYKRNSLLGAMVFYLKDEEALPKRHLRKRLTERVRSFSRLAAGIISDHESGEKGIQQPVKEKKPKNHIFEYWPRACMGSVEDLFYAILTVQRKWTKIKSEEVAGKIQSLLSGVDLLCIRDTDYRHGLRFWTTGLLHGTPPKPESRNEFARFLRNQIAKAVANTVADHGKVSLHIKVNGHRENA